MSADDLKAAWCVPVDEMWYRAVLQKIDDALEDALDISTTFQTASNHGLLAHSIGGLEALPRFAKNSSAHAARLLKSSAPLYRSISWC